MTLTISPRENEVLARVAAAWRYDEIASDLGISQQTVKNHMSSIIARLGVSNGHEAGLLYRAGDWRIPNDELEIPPKPILDGRLGRIYFIQEPLSGAIKIGYTIAVEKRLAAIQSHNPNELSLLGWVQGRRNDESKLHKYFEKQRIRGEWFKPSDELLWFIEENNGRTRNETEWPFSVRRLKLWDHGDN